MQKFESLTTRMTIEEGEEEEGQEQSVAQYSSIKIKSDLLEVSHGGLS